MSWHQGMDTEYPPIFCVIFRAWISSTMKWRNDKYYTTVTRTELILITKSLLGERGKIPVSLISRIRVRDFSHPAFFTWRCTHYYPSNTLVIKYGGIIFSPNKLFFIFLFWAVLKVYSWFYNQRPLLAVLRRSYEVLGVELGDPVGKSNNLPVVFSLWVFTKKISHTSWMS